MLKASSLLGQSQIRRTKASRGRRTLVASLMLTSLVDAFSILVIFLIMNCAANQMPIDVGNVNLPQAQESEFIQNGVVVRVEGRQFVVNDKPVALAGLAAQLKAMNKATPTQKSQGLIVVADRNMNYAELSPVILAGSSAGFTKFKFAVIRK